MSSHSSDATLDDPLPGSIGAPALRALRGVGIETYADLLSWPEDALVQLHAVGPTALGILRIGLVERGADFAPQTSA